MLITVSVFQIGFAQEVDVPSQTFDLGAVQGVWDKTAQTLTLQGNGQIDRQKWQSLKYRLKLTDKELTKIEFKPGVQFPDDASQFFFKFRTSNLIFPSRMNTSNLKDMTEMFDQYKNFNSPIGDWDVTNVTSMKKTFH